MSIRYYQAIALRCIGLLAVLWLGTGTAVHACDSYDGTDLTIAKVVLGNTVYTNVVVAVTVANVRAVGAAVGNPSTADSYDLFDPGTGLLTIACVKVGNTTFSSVVTGIGQVVSVGGAYALPTAPELIPVFPLADATVGQDYAQSVVVDVIPHSRYTFSMDTLANGNGLPSGMTLDMNGVLSGKPFATGAADVNGNQIPHQYTFGVCATDTLSRLTTTPCPQTTITVNPAPLNVAGTWSGNWTNTGPGDGGCTYNDSGTLKLTLKQTGTTLSGTAAATGIQLRWVPSCDFAMTTQSQGAITGTFDGNTVNIAYTLPISETGGNINYSWSATLVSGTTLKGTRVSQTQNGSFALSHQYGSIVAGQHFQQFNVKGQVRVGLDMRPNLPLAIGQMRRYP
jgi:hypothetical protein